MALDYDVRLGRCVVHEIVIVINLSLHIDDKHDDEEYVRNKQQQDRVFKNQWPCVLN